MSTQKPYVLNSGDLPLKSIISNTTHSSTVTPILNDDSFKLCCICIAIMFLSLEFWDVKTLPQDHRVMQSAAL